MACIAILLLACATAQDGADAPRVIVRHDAGGVSDESEGIVEAWRAEGDELVSGVRRLPAADLAALRGLVLERRCYLESTPADPGPACFDAVGIDAELFEARRSEWLQAALSEFWKGWGPTSTLLAEVGPRIEWTALRPEIVRWTCGGGIQSVHAARTEIELAGEPPIRLSAWSELPGRLPWIVQVGEQRWASADVEISRRLRPFAPLEGDCGKSLDGDAYWQGEFWTDRQFWRRQRTGGLLDELLCKSVYERLEGWNVADGFMRVERVESGWIGITLPALEFDLEWRAASAIERVSWSNPRSDVALRHSWIELLAAWQDAKHTVVREGWIDEWKRAGPQRTLTLELEGTGLKYDAPLEDLTLPAWRAAGFRGIPDWKLRFRRAREGAATIYLSRDQPGALVEWAQAGPGEHWLDAQAFSFHPRAKPPTYGRIDSAGRFELRTLP